MIDLQLVGAGQEVGDRELAGAEVGNEVVVPGTAVQPIVRSADQHVVTGSAEQGLFGLSEQGDACARDGLPLLVTYEAVRLCCGVVEGT